MTDVKWIKLSTNMFDDEKIKLIRTMPEGDSIILVWVQLLLIAGRINDGGLVYIGQNLYYTDEMLATICDQPLNIMRLALTTLERFDMIGKNEEGLIGIVNWEKHQSTDKMARMKEQSRIRQQKYYYRNKLRESGVNVDEEGFTDDLEQLKEMHTKLEEQPNVRLTLANDTEVRSKKLEDRSKKLEVSKEHTPAKAEPHIPYKEIVDHLNEKADRNFKHTTDKTKRLIEARLNEGFDEKDFEQVVDIKVAEWKETDMAKFLRPETLFGPKFEGYLNQPAPPTDRGNDYSDFDFFE